MNAIEAMSAVHDRPRELAIASHGRTARTPCWSKCAIPAPAWTRSAPSRCSTRFIRRAEGIGIGLSISRSIIEAHGGRLWASANAPHGVFRFSLPVAEEAVEHEDRAVVFVDDDPSMRRALETLLRSVGHDVRLFSSAQEFSGRAAGRTGLPRARRAAAWHERTRVPAGASRKQVSLFQSSSSPGTATFR